MGAPTADQIDELLHLAYAGKDVEAVADLYEDDGIFANTGGGWTAVGRAEIIDRVTAMFSMFDVSDWVTDRVRFIVAGDYAFSHDTSTTRVSSADGTELEIHGRGTTIARRGADGEWRLVIDHASAR